MGEISFNHGMMLETYQKLEWEIKSNDRINKLKRILKLER